jgi:hypothetical protein
MVPPDSSPREVECKMSGKQIEHDMQLTRQRSMIQVSNSLENFTIHDSLTVLEASLPLIMYKLIRYHAFLEEREVVGLHAAFDISPHLEILN